MSCWTKEQLENMLKDVVSTLDLSDGMIEEHGPLGTTPSELVKLVLHRKDMEIAMLKKGFVDIENSAQKSKPRLRRIVLEEVAPDELCMEHDVKLYGKFWREVKEINFSLTNEEPELSLSVDEAKELDDYINQECRLSTELETKINEFVKDK